MGFVIHAYDILGFRALKAQALTQIKYRGLKINHHQYHYTSVFLNLTVNEIPQSPCLLLKAPTLSPKPCSSAGDVLRQVCLGAAASKSGLGYAGIAAAVSIHSDSDARALRHNTNPAPSLKL